MADPRVMMTSSDTTDEDEDEVEAEMDSAHATDPKEKEEQVVLKQDEDEDKPKKILKLCIRMKSPSKSIPSTATTTKSMPITKTTSDDPSTVVKSNLEASTSPQQLPVSTPMKKRRRMVLPLQTNKKPKNQSSSPQHIPDGAKSSDSQSPKDDNLSVSLGSCTSTTVDPLLSIHQQPGKLDMNTNSTSPRSSPTKPKMSIVPKGPSLATPSVASEKRILLHAGPADNLPAGWTIKHYKRTTGLKHTDRYWFSPLLKKKFRSVAQVNRFLDFLTKENGDEAKAWDLFRTSPPGPDEIRSVRNRPQNVKGETTKSSTASNSNPVSKDSTTSKSITNTSSSSGTGTSNKRPSNNNSTANGTKTTSQANHAGFSKCFRLPSLSSPGLYLVAPPSLLHRSKHMPVNSSNNTTTPAESRLVTTSEGYITPSCIFNHSLHIAGYSHEYLKDAKFFGSSVTKSIDDMFGSSVVLDGIQLVPDYASSSSTTGMDRSDEKLGLVESKENDNESIPSKSSTEKTNTFDGLKDQLQKFIQKRKVSHDHYSTPFEAMLPKSLSTPLSEKYVQERKTYFEKVQAREESIRLDHKQKQNNEKRLDEFEDAKGIWLDKKEYYEKQKLKLGFDEERIKQELHQDDPGPMPTSPELSPPIDILDVPTPPLLDRNDIKQGDLDSAISKNFEVSDRRNDDHNDDTSSPTTLSEDPSRDRLDCVPQDKVDLVAHLDPDCFRYPEGRYYGLTSNLLADPQFVGPNSVGITGVNSSTTGLATSYSGGTYSSLTTLTHSERGSTTLEISDTNGAGIGDRHLKKGSRSDNKSKTQPISQNTNYSKGSSNTSRGDKILPGPTPTVTSMNLKKVMEQGGKYAENMREAIIRAAVIASRNGTHGGSFVVAGGETYPDVSKAFSNYGNLKPCIRCKNNKQGAYHCRLRRKHQDQDYDGGTSASILKALFDMSYDDLIKASTISNCN